MCYSAMVKQRAKFYSLKFGARIQSNAYEELVSRRLAGEKLLINKEMEYQFTQEAETMQDRRIGKLIREWHEKQVPILEAELKKQQERLEKAEESLKKKETKKALEDQRIATNKISKISFDIERHKTEELMSEVEAKIYPHHYFSMLYLNEKNEKCVMPFRYLMRPHDKGESFDREFHGCYNARFDNLTRVAWWKDSLEKRHGVMIVEKFYENVGREDYLKSHKGPKDIELKVKFEICFEPKATEYIVIPTIWDKWQKKGQSPLYSAALITDEPEPEVAATGHDRTPIFLREEMVDEWLFSSGRSTSEVKEILQQRERPYYRHRILGAG